MWWLRDDIALTFSRQLNIAFLVVAFMGMLMIMFRSSFLAVDDYGDDNSHVKNTRLVDDDVYEDGEERAYPAHIRDTDPDEGSFVSNVSDDEDVYTSTGYDDDNDRYEFEQEIARNQSRATAPRGDLYPEDASF